MNLTDLERSAIKAIIHNDYQNGTDAEDIIGNPVWTFSVVDALGVEGVSPQAAGGVMASLKTKGAVTINPYDHNEDVIALTVDGFEAFTFPNR